MRGGFWQELLEVFQEIGSRLEEVSDLIVDVLNWFRFALVSLQDFKELFVDVWMCRKAVLCGRKSAI